MPVFRPVCIGNDDWHQTVSGGLTPGVMTAANPAQHSNQLSCRPMKESTCKHCGMAFDADLSACPYCNTPTPGQQDPETTGTKKRFIRYFVILVIFCIFMILWLPRDI